MRFHAAGILSFVVLWQSLFAPGDLQLSAKAKKGLYFSGATTTSQIDTILCRYGAIVEREAAKHWDDKTLSAKRHRRTNDRLVKREADKRQAVADALQYISKFNDPKALVDLGKMIEAYVFANLKLTRWFSVIYENDTEILFQKELELNEFAKGLAGQMVAEVVPYLQDKIPTYLPIKVLLFKWLALLYVTAELSISTIPCAKFFLEAKSS